MLTLLLAVCAVAASTPEPPLRIREQVEPTYPPAAQQLTLEGDCRIRVTVDLDGLPQSATAVECPMIFQDSSTNAALASQFFPSASAGDLRVIDFTYHFALTPIAGCTSPESDASDPSPADCDCDRPSRLGQVLGIATDDSGAPIPGVEVTINAPRLPCDHGYTDYDGRRPPRLRHGRPSDRPPTVPSP